ncbi:Conserved_hypothetical protein [Hexamita inflata]|uniref:Transposase n=1 Tax=Hexamita inflata TaxID=28002 RepID=A0ABP1KZJ6_9EUKA
MSQSSETTQLSEGKKKTFEQIVKEMIKKDPLTNSQTIVLNLTVGIDAEDGRKQCLLCVGIHRRIIRHYNKSGYADIIAHIISQHDIAFNDIWSAVPTMLQSLQTKPIIRATAYEEWLNGTIIHFVEKFQSFRSVESQGFNKMSKFSISATSLKDQILLMGAQIEASQFDVYNRNQTYATIIYDGFKTQGGQHIVTFMLKTYLKIHFIGSIYTTEKQDGIWLAKQLKQKIELLESQYNFCVTSLSSDNAYVCSKAHALLCGLRDDISEEVEAQTKLSHKIVLLRCSAHVLDLCLKDYCVFYNIKQKLDCLSKMYDIDISVCPTRWASFQTAFEQLSKCIPSNMSVDMKIVQFTTATILQVEANHIDHSNWDRLINQLKTNLRSILNDAGNIDDRAQLMLLIIESREDKYMTTHNKISNFYKQIDPLNEETRLLNEISKYSALKQSCREIGSKFSIQYLENYDQISRQLKQPSLIKNAHDYLNHSSNGKTDMLPYLKAVWKNNEYMVGLLSIFETLTVSNGSVERLFSFYHRQTSHFLRRNLDYKTLDAMAYIYVEKITNNINHVYTDDDENEVYE